ncbi:putative permease [Herminiimonas arsenicoxydans]|uniref:Permease n=1 Tax=Herminiimonas arsenicoxydans TaxID=204773 RepID=A4G5Q3_HERAR|nr:putative permease [Herminiimonas arsenicoxydans]
MIQRALSYDRTPPLSVPLRFFLSAPIFLFAAAALLLWEGPLALLSRWTPATLALTHLLTLGFLSMAMIGALLQILPVVADIQLPFPQATARFVHALLAAGAILLACAFWHSYPLLFRLALLCLVPAFLWLLTACFIGMRNKPKLKSKAAGTVGAIRLAVIALVITVLLGAALASTFAWPHALPTLLLTDLHVLWGLSGWVGLLVIGVAFQVVPMFQVTALYPVDITRVLAGTLFLLLILWSTEAMLESQWNTVALSGMILSGFIVFAGITLYLLARRKNPKLDASTLFWATAMASLFVCAAVWLTQTASGHKAYALTLGVLFIIGFAGSLINGMLYRIVPFLLWYHAQNETGEGVRQIPNVRQLLPEQTAIRQFRMHLLALLLLIGATLLPEVLARPAALAMCISSGWLFLNLLNAVRMHAAARKSRISTFVSA